MTTSICYEIIYYLIFGFIIIIIIQNIPTTNISSQVERFTLKNWKKVKKLSQSIKNINKLIVIKSLNTNKNSFLENPFRKLSENIIQYKQQKSMQEQNRIIIGSYPYRGTVNICRMICEYLNIPYQNVFFNPLSWRVYKQKQSDQWLFQQLPFLVDGNFVVTQAFPMCQYIIKKSGNLDLLGKTLEDSLIVDNFLWGKDLIQNVLSLVVQNKNNPKKLMEEMHSSWIKTIRSQLLEYQKNAKIGQFYLGYLTVIDFILHEIFEHYKSIFRKQVALFPKLLSVRQKVASIQKIKQFEKSDRTVHQICPLEFYKKWKMETLKTSNQQ